MRLKKQIGSEEMHLQSSGKVVNLDEVKAGDRGRNRP